MQIHYISCTKGNTEIKLPIWPQVIGGVYENSDTIAVRVAGALHQHGWVYYTYTPDPTPDNPHKVIATPNPPRVTTEKITKGHHHYKEPIQLAQDKAAS